MRLRLHEDPREWRKAACLGALGFAILSSILRWRGILTYPAWQVILVVLCLMALSGWLRPRWFRGYYRFMSRVSFRLMQFIGFAALALLFVTLFVPVGIVLRLAGKDLLRLKRRGEGGTYWTPAKPESPLERSF